MESFKKGYVMPETMEAPPQSPPGLESKMTPRPKSYEESYRPSGKLEHKVALVTGADSGIGKAVAILFAKEGADVAIVYLNEHSDVAETRGLIEKEGRRCIAISGDVGDEEFCKRAVERCQNELGGGLDVLINNAAEQHPQQEIEQITVSQLERTFRTNIFGYFLMTQAALPLMKAGSTIVNTASVTAFKGSPKLLDYSATKGAIVAFTRSLSLSVIERGIRVNAVAPGPIWTPLIPSTFPKEKVEQFGKDVPMGRPGQPFEVATAFLFLASQDSSYFSGQVLHPNGGEVLNT